MDVNFVEKKICFLLYWFFVLCIVIKVQLVLLIYWSPDTCWCLSKMHRILFMTRKNIFLCYKSWNVYCFRCALFLKTWDIVFFSITLLTKPSGPIFLDLWRRGKSRMIVSIWHFKWHCFYFAKCLVLRFFVLFKILHFMFMIDFI